MSLRLTILGCHSATPRVNAFPTSQYLEINDRHFIIDCGEGTQRQMRKYKVGYSKINHIFISHLHGDHFYGLIGLLSTFGILNREKELHVFGPKGIKESTEMLLNISQSHAKYKLIFHELSSTKSELIFEDEKVSVHTIPLKHRVYTNGFLFKEKIKPKKLHIQNIGNYPEIDKADYLNIKAGRNIVLPSGEVISNEELTIESEKPKSFAYCSDTCFLPSIIPIIKNADLLYHEATFLSDKEDLARKTLHSTALQAATIAKEANVKQLILGHYSGRYKNTELFQEEAKTIFSETLLAEPGKIIEVN
ncbi:MAG: ribonuclease Z [Polaribacter sp.]|jgi:ribonuclease Z|nr:ribonuclease Z [Polaribacter sp.]MDP4703491.1 ribonuclease Z [Polaribacter sp.]MDP4988696.1 ribonuclease Z [Polaribacter sp.]